MAKIIGLTGGIATGKSTVSKMFKENNIPVIDSDHIAKSLLNKGSDAYQEIIAEFSDEILTTNGEINRKKLAEKLFSDIEIREKINGIIHPRVKEIVRREITRLESYGENMIVIDVPLLFETDFHQECDVSVLVYARQKDQVERLVERNQISEEYAMKKIKAQLPMSKKKALADIVIDNSKSILETRKAFDKVLERMKKE